MVVVLVKRDREREVGKQPPSCRNFNDFAK